MKGIRVLFVSRSESLFPLAKLYAKKAGQSDIRGTTKDGSALNKIIIDDKPRLVIFEESFYDTATPYMLRRLQKKIPWLNIAVISLGFCAEEMESRFVSFGIESYISLHYGGADFIHGFKAIMDGKKYVAWKLRKRIDELELTHEPSERESDREDEILVMMANGKHITEIARLLCISERTVAHHKTSIFDHYQVEFMADFIRAAQNSGKIILNGSFYLARKEIL